jgi:hypothetical protein
MMKYKDGGIFQDRDGMKAPQDIDGGSAKPKKPKKKPSRTKLPPLRPGQIDMPSDPDDGSVGMKHGGGVKDMHRMPDGKMMKDSAHDDKKKDAPMMQKVAARAVKSHEKRMHSNEKTNTSTTKGYGMARGGKVCKVM